MAEVQLTEVDKIYEGGVHAVQDLSLFVLNGVTRNATDLVTFGYRSQIWTRGNTTFVLVSPSGEDGRLVEATRYMMKEAER